MTTAMPHRAPAGIHLFGIRHHGPGSARSLRAALEVLRPDVILVEGPPDAADVLPLLVHADMRPPVALLIYAPESPRHAVYYPFAIFSPEWQALHFGLSCGIPVRFMDLPQTHQFAALTEAVPEVLDGDGESSGTEGDGSLPAAIDSESASPGSTDALPLPPPSVDPLGWLAAAAGYSDGERWWEHMVEQRREAGDIFVAILEAMVALRDESPPDPDVNEARREAWMRQSIRAARREGFQRIAVVCGAWHTPALRDLDDAQGDALLLRKLPRIKVQATWVPWTYGRLSYRSGYGAGIESPGWYEHLWQTRGDSSVDVAARWMVRVARLLRDQDLDASSAHVIEAVRLAETLAALRDRPLPGLVELNEASQAVFCFGSELPMRLIHERLIVGETLGAVPNETPLAPLQQDLAREQRRLRMPSEASWRDYDLDLRRPNDLERSHVLHRLWLLGVPWGALQRSGGGKGTFHEVWRVQWQPELAVALIDAGCWGNTIADASTAFACDAADHAADLPTLTKLVDQALLADLPDAVAHIMGRLRNEAAVASDIAHVMEALPPLANVLRYGNVRNTDAGAVAEVIEGLLARIYVGLPPACATLNDEAARAMFERLLALHSAIVLVRSAEQLVDWYETLRRLVDLHGGHGLIAGRSCRILLDSAVFDTDEAARRVGLALSAVVVPTEAAAWVEGLLDGSGALLVHDDALWSIIDQWLTALPPAAFTQTLPLLRRTFATFAAPERRLLGERAQKRVAAHRRSGGAADVDEGQYDHARGAGVLPLLEQLLGVPGVR